MMESTIDLEYELLKLTLMLYNNPLIPRKIVQFFIDSLIRFIFNLFIRILIENIKLIHKDEKVVQDVEKIVYACKEIFAKFQTEHRRFAMYRNKGLMIDPQEFEIDAESRAFGMFIPLKWTLKKFLQIPGAMNLLKNHMTQLINTTDIISNFVQGDFWRRKLSNSDPNKFYVPLFMFFDDIEVGNPLGSHAGKNKLGAVYFTIPGFPTYISSKLSNIITSTIFFFER